MPQEVNQSTKSNRSVFVWDSLKGPLRVALALLNEVILFRSYLIWDQDEDQPDE